MIIKLLEFVKAHWRGFLMGCFVAFLCLKVHSCDKKHYTQNPPVAPVKTPLPTDDNEQIIIGDNGKVEVKTPTKDTTVGGTHGTTIDIKKDGTVKVTEKIFGFEHRIGFDGFISERMGLGLDLRYFYYKQFDAMAGIGYMPQDQHLTGWLGLGYTPSTSWMSNTTVFVGYTVTKYAIAGVSVRF